MDSKTLFGVVVKDGGTTEKRLEIDIYAIQECYEVDQLTKINWIPGKKFPADALTKQSFSEKNQLWNLIKNVQLDISALGCSTDPSLN